MFFKVFLTFQSLRYKICAGIVLHSEWHVLTNSTFRCTHA